MSKQYFAITKRIASEYGIELDRAEVVSTFTNQATESLSSLSGEDKQALCRFLNNTYPPKANHKPDSPENKMRRKIIAFFHKMGYADRSTGKVPMQIINDWCIKYGKYHKPLQQHNNTELAHLVTQAENRYRSYIENTNF